MTDDMMNLRTLLEKTSDADVVRELIGCTSSGGRKCLMRQWPHKPREIHGDRKAAR